MKIFCIHNSNYCIIMAPYQQTLFKDYLHVGYAEHYKQRSKVLQRF